MLPRTPTVAVLERLSRWEFMGDTTNMHDMDDTVRRSPTFPAADLGLVTARQLCNDVPILWRHGVWGERCDFR